MSFTPTRAIIAMAADGRLSAQAVLVGCMIHAFIDTHGRSPSMPVLAVMCRTDERNVYRYRDELIANGWIEKEVVSGVGASYSLPDERVAAIEEYIERLRTPVRGTRGRRPTPDIHTRGDWPTPGSRTRGTPGAGARGRIGTPGSQTTGSSPAIVSNNYTPPEERKEEGLSPSASPVEVEREAPSPIPSGTSAKRPSPPVAPRSPIPVAELPGWSEDRAARQAELDAAQERKQVEDRDRRPRTRQGTYEVKDHPLTYDIASARIVLVNGVGAKWAEGLAADFPGIRLDRVLNLASAKADVHMLPHRLMSLVRQYAQYDADDRRKERAAEKSKLPTMRPGR